MGRVDSWAYARGEVTWEELCAQVSKPSHVKDSKLKKVRRALEKGPKKGKCCQDRPRCVNCPTVVHRLKKESALTLDDEGLRLALIKARKW
ncbi:hypothetical protein [Corynebacterium vitaeruminis]|uniref:hypothetical protein n=1 Tax=Corynebacterium vitaeruminis TaxID=38305 RepID=UPI001FD43864|nr:hypothetical protein [Corynebacterium vitaeruminis]